MQNVGSNVSRRLKIHLLGLLFVCKLCYKDGFPPSTSIFFNSQVIVSNAHHPISALLSRRTTTTSIIEACHLSCSSFSCFVLLILVAMDAAVHHSYMESAPREPKMESGVPPSVGHIMGADDPANPQNFPFWRKVYASAVATGFAFAVLVSTCFTSEYPT